MLDAALLLIALFALFIIDFMAGLSIKALDETRRGVPESERRGASIFPIIPLCPLLIWGLVLIIDLFSDKEATKVIGGICLVFIPYPLFVLVKNLFKIKALMKQLNLTSKLARLHIDVAESSARKNELTIQTLFVS